MKNTRRAPRKLHISLYSLLLTLLALALLAACRQAASPDARLLRAEALMDEHPDSALWILNQISYTDIKSERERALFGLLNVMAKDKNYLDISGDSLIDISVEWYEGHSDDTHYIEALFRQGRVRYESGQYAQAIVSYLKAQSLSERKGLNRLAGLSCRGISDVYAVMHLPADELAYAQKEVEYMNMEPERTYHLYGLLDLARAHFNIGDSLETIRITMLLEDSALRVGDDYLRLASMRLRKDQFMRSRRYEHAVHMLDTIIKSGCGTSEDSLHYAYSVLMTGETARGKAIMQNVTDTTSIWYSMFRYGEAYSGGNYEEALKRMDELSEMTEQAVSARKSKELVKIIEDYHQLNVKSMEIKAENDRLRKQILIIILCFVSVGLLIVILLKVISHRREIQSKVQLAERLSEKLLRQEAAIIEKEAKIIENDSTLTSKEVRIKELSALLSQNRENSLAQEQERTRIQEELLRLREEVSNQTEIVAEKNREIDLRTQSLLTSRNELEKMIKAVTANEKIRNDIIRRFVIMYDSLQRSGNRQSMIAKSIDSFIGSFSLGGDSQKELERMADTIYDNIMESFRKDFPTMKAGMRTHFLLLIFGFSTEAIMVFLRNKDAQSVYNEKRRLKQKILDSESERKDEYLEFLV